MRLSETLKMTRQKAFLSQEAFSKEIGVSVSSINRWETGKSKPNLSAMKKLKDFCQKYELSYTEIESEWFNNNSDKE